MIYFKHDDAFERTIAQSNRKGSPALIPLEVRYKKKTYHTQVDPSMSLMLLAEEGFPFVFIDIEITVQIVC